MTEAPAVMVETESRVSAVGPERALPRLGFLGLGRIGVSRLEAVLRAQTGAVAAFADTDEKALVRAQALVPEARVVAGLDGLLAEELDGVVIATPSAMHAAQSIQALEAGCAVFCQKPLARTAAETAQVIHAARRSDRRLAVDLSYRHTRGMRAIRKLIREGGIGRVYAAEMVFHNAYGPDRAWFYDRAASGGGCLIDLGTHLVDLALWCLDFPEMDAVASRLFVGGRAVSPPMQELATGAEQSLPVEDYAAAQLQLADGAVVQLATSWRAPAGCDARIEVTFFGTEGGAGFTNVDGSFLDFVAEHFLPDRRRVPLARPPEDWGGGAINTWARSLASSAAYDPSVEEVQRVAEVLDAIYLAAS